MNKNLMKRIIKAGGGQSALARRLNELGDDRADLGLLSRIHVHQWRRVPAERVVHVEQATGISREEIRPDIFY